MPLSSVEDIVNLALRDIGYARPISDMYEGSKASRAALDVYGQTRDELLADNDWTWARRDVPLVLLKTAPPGGYSPLTLWTNSYPPLPWKYEYAYPDDVILVRSARPTPIFVPNYAPQPWVIGVINDAATGKTSIVSNAPNAILTYTARVVDPLQWEDPAFTIALVARLAKKLVLPLGGTLDGQKIKIAEAAAALQAANSR